MPFTKPSTCLNRHVLLLFSYQHGEQVKVEDNVAIGHFYIYTFQVNIAWKINQPDIKILAVTCIEYSNGDTKSPHFVESEYCTS